MKILVMSDSHGAEEKLIEMIKEYKDADVLVFLGDGARDFENALAVCDIFPYGKQKKEIFQVCGNCDLYSDLEDTVTGEFDGVKMLITHGFVQSVKRGYEKLADEAKRKNCSAALFGHTHAQYCGRDGNVVLFNPGSARSGSYGVITIENGEAQYRHRYI